MTKLKMVLAAFTVIAIGAVAYAQGIGGVGFWPNWPIVAQPSYCSSTTNSTCTNTVPAGPSALTGRETIPANAGNTTSGPANILLTPTNLNANPITFVSVTSTNPANISASNLSGGVIYNATATITAANITLPISPAHLQQFVVSANRTITALTVNAASGDTVAANSQPSVMTASTTVPQGYRFVCNKASLTASCTWLRLQ